MVNFEWKMIWRNKNWYFGNYLILVPSVFKHNYLHIGPHNRSLKTAMYIQSILVIGKCLHWFGIAMNCKCVGWKYWWKTQHASGK